MRGGQSRQSLSSLHDDLGSGALRKITLCGLYQETQRTLKNLRMVMRQDCGIAREGSLTYWRLCVRLDCIFVQPIERTDVHFSARPRRVFVS